MAFQEAAVLMLLEPATIADIDEALSNVRDTLHLPLTAHQREAAEDYRDRLLDRRNDLAAPAHHR